jgi:hypothetical protein
MTPAALVSEPSAATCPSCGRALRRSRLDAEPATPVDTGRLSDTELFRHHKRTGPVEDLRFFLRHARLSSDVRMAGDALLTAGCRDTGGILSRSEWYRRLKGLQDRWRRARAAVLLPNVLVEMAEAV